ncbi:hypothetical protein [Caulobacter sp.]|uniref:hypothetical protein n=1 Tax=Caulobacter sp. TaxID=78 RepID=UPI00161B5C62
MRPSLAILALSAAAVLATPALATPFLATNGDDEVISTAQAKSSVQALTATAPPPPVVETTVRQLTTQEQIDAFLAPARAADARQRVLLKPSHDFADYYVEDGLDDRDADGKRKIHGQMSVSVGTGGYRSASASALIPVGETTTVGIAVSKTDFGRNGGWAYGDGFYGNGGYGYGGYPMRMRGGQSQSLAVSVMGGSGARRSTAVPEGCAPGFRDGGRYVEPLWVGDMRDGAHPCSAAER